MGLDLPCLVEIVKQASLGPVELLLGQPPLPPHLQQTGTVPVISKHPSMVLQHGDSMIGRLLIQCLVPLSKVVDLVFVVYPALVLPCGVLVGQILPPHKVQSVYRVIDDRDRRKFLFGKVHIILGRDINMSVLLQPIEAEGAGVEFLYLPRQIADLVLDIIKSLIRFPMDRATGGFLV